ncbi:MAG: DUF2924 domain-containing protein [Pseudomonadota bacterium]
MTCSIDRMTDIEEWDRAKCLEAWCKLTGAEPTERLSTRFLRQALVFEAQCKELGGHSSAVKRSLKANANVRGTSKANPAVTLSCGTQLVREWNGRIYRVNVSADGFEMDGRSFNSLSAVAKQITGAQWSGPRFFGLNGQGS